MRCYLCSMTCEPITTEKFSLFHYCPRCHTHYRDKDAILVETEEKNRYLLHQNSFNDIAYQEYFIRFIEHTLVPFVDLSYPIPILDFGSGPQPVLAEVMGQYFQQEVAYFDPYFAPNRKVLQEKYQVITLVEVAEHIADPLDLFASLKSLLFNQGILAISTRLWSESLGEFQDWWYMHDPTHLTFYSQATFEDIAQHFNFKILLMKPPSYIVLQKRP